MEKRMHSLEDALAIIHIDDQPHPLLANRDQFMEQLNSGTGDTEGDGEDGSGVGRENEMETATGNSKGKGKEVVDASDFLKGSSPMGGALFVEGNDEHEAARYFGLLPLFLWFYFDYSYLDIEKALLAAQR
jgi:hypothetical protein